MTTDRVHVARAAVEESLAIDEKRVHQMLQQSGMPTHIVSRYWGGGSRLGKLRGPRFREGLVRAVMADEFVRSLVHDVWRFGNEPFVNAITSSRNRWPDQQSPGLLTPRAVEFVACRFQPSQVQVEWLALVVGGGYAQAYEPLIQRLADTPTGAAAVSPSPSPSGLREILTREASSVEDITLELLGLIFHHRVVSPEILDQLRAEDHAGAAEALEHSQQPDLATEAAALWILSGHPERAHFDPPDDNGADSLDYGAAVRLAIEAFQCYAQGEFERAADLAARAPVPWPAWQLLEGIAQARTGNYREAARAFLRGGVPRRNYSILPVQLAAASLLEAGLPLPEEFPRLLEAGRATWAEREAVWQVLDLLLERSKRNARGAIAATTPPTSTEGSRPKVAPELLADVASPSTSKAEIVKVTPSLPTSPAPPTDRPVAPLGPYACPNLALALQSASEQVERMDQGLGSEAFITAKVGGDAALREFQDRLGRFAELKNERDRAVAELQTALATLWKRALTLTGYSDGRTLLGTLDEAAELAPLESALCSLEDELHIASQLGLRVAAPAESSDSLIRALEAYKEKVAAAIAREHESRNTQLGRLREQLHALMADLSGAKVLGEVAEQMALLEASEPTAEAIGAAEQLLRRLKDESARRRKKERATQVRLWLQGEDSEHSSQPTPIEVAQVLDAGEPSELEHLDSKRVISCLMTEAQKRSALKRLLSGVRGPEELLKWAELAAEVGCTREDLTDVKIGPLQGGELGHPSERAALLIAEMLGDHARDLGLEHALGLLAALAAEGPHDARQAATLQLIRVLGDESPRFALLLCLGFIEKGEALDGELEAAALSSWLKGSSWPDISHVLDSLRWTPSVQDRARSNPRWALLFAAYSTARSVGQAEPQDSPELFHQAIQEIMPQTHEVLHDLAAGLDDHGSVQDAQVRRDAEAIRSSVNGFIVFRTKQLNHAERWRENRVRPRLLEWLQEICAGGDRARRAAVQVRRSDARDWVHRDASEHSLDQGSPLWRRTIAQLDEWTASLTALAETLAEEQLPPPPRMRNEEALATEWQSLRRDEAIATIVDRLIRPLLAADGSHTIDASDRTVSSGERLRITEEWIDGERLKGCLPETYLSLRQQARLPAEAVDTALAELARQSDPIAHVASLAEAGHVAVARHVLARIGDSTGAEFAARTILDWADQWRDDLSSRIGVLTTRLGGFQASGSAAAFDQEVRQLIQKAQTAVRAEMFADADRELQDAELWFDTFEETEQAAQQSAIAELDAASQVLLERAAELRLQDSEDRRDAATYLVSAVAREKLAEAIGAPSDSRRLILLRDGIQAVLTDDQPAFVAYAELQRGLASIQQGPKQPSAEGRAAPPPPASDQLNSGGRADLLYQEALNFHKLRNWTTAEQVLQFALAQAPDHLDSRVLLARVYLRQRKLRDAVEVLRPVPAPHLPVRVVLDLARACMDEGQPREAMRVLEDSLASLVGHEDELQVRRLALEAACLSSESPQAWDHFEALRLLGESTQSLENFQVFLNSGGRDRARLSRVTSPTLSEAWRPSLFIEDRLGRLVAHLPPPEELAATSGRLAVAEYLGNRVEPWLKRPAHQRAPEDLLTAAAVLRRAQEVGQDLEPQHREYFRRLIGEVLQREGDRRIREGEVARDSGRSLLVEALVVGNRDAYRYAHAKKALLSLLRDAAGQDLDARTDDAVAKTALQRHFDSIEPALAPQQEQEWARATLDMLSRVPWLLDDAADLPWEKWPNLWRCLSETVRVADDRRSPRIQYCVTAFQAAYDQLRGTLRGLHAAIGRDSVEEMQAAQQRVIADEWFLSRRDNELLNRLERLIDQRVHLRLEVTFDEAERLHRGLLQQLEEMDRGIDDMPSHLAYEAIRPVLRQVRSAITQQRTQRLERMMPQLSVRSEGCFVSDDGLLIHLTVSNDPGRASAIRCHMHCTVEDAGDDVLAVIDIGNVSADQSQPVKLSLPISAARDYVVPLRCLLRHEVETASGTTERREVTLPVVVEISPRGFEPIDDPFRIEGTLQDRKLFKGQWRLSLIEQLTDSIVQRHHTVAHTLIGQMRSGKSSLLKRLREDVAQSGVPVAHVESPGGGIEASVADITSKLNRALAASGAKPPKEPSEALKNGSLGKITIAFRSFFSALPELNVRPLLIIDELQQVLTWERPQSEHLLRLLKELVDQHAVSVICAGNDRMLRLIERHPNELAVSGTIWMQWFTDDDARELVEDSLRYSDGKSRFSSPEVNRRLNDLAGGNPWHLQYLGKQLVEFINTRKLTFVSPLHLRDFLDQLLEPGSGRFEPKDRFHNLSMFSDYEKEHASREECIEGYVLRMIALASRSQRRVALDRLRLKLGVGSTVQEAELDRCLRSMVKRGVLAEDLNSYRVLVGLFTEWAQRNLREEDLRLRFEALLRESEAARE